ncbi:MAG: nicotinate (nicotinamide) nucleotide adenylyltransferase [Ruminococcus sp.]
MSRIAMFGGSFNPVHKAHRKFTEKVIESLELDKIYIVPTYSSPHKQGFDMASPKDRYNMCRIAFKGVEKAEVSDIEINRKGKSYTCDTLAELSRIHCNDRIFLVMGADMYLTLQDWKNPEKIFSLATIVTFPRDSDNYESLKKHSEFLKNMGAKSVILNEKVIKLSSTTVRENIRNKEFVNRFLDKKVYKYIVDNNLYGM